MPGPVGGLEQLTVASQMRSERVMGGSKWVVVSEFIT